MIAILPIGQKRQFSQFISRIVISTFEALPATADRSAVPGTTNELITRRAENRGGKHLRTCSLLLLFVSSPLAFGQSGDAGAGRAAQPNQPSQSQSSATVASSSGTSPSRAQQNAAVTAFPPNETA